MTLSRFVRDSFFGRMTYHLSSHRLFRHQEEEPDYVIPERYLSKSDSPNEGCYSENSTETLTNHILVTWDENDPENPENWPLWEKIIFIIEICFLTVVVYMASAIYTPGVDQIMKDLNTTRIKATLPLTMFVIGYGVGPMVFSPMSENGLFGRTYIYIATLFLFVVLQIPTALVNDITSLTILRFLSGVFGSPALATGGASMGDITHKPYLPITLAIYFVSTSAGPSIGPLIGSILIVKRNWHWTFWFVCMASGIAFIVFVFFLPETYDKKLLMRRAQRLRKLTGNPNIISEAELENRDVTAKQLAIETLWRPIEISFFEPVVLLINLYIALVYSVLYLWFEAFPIVFRDNLGFGMITSGATFLSIVVGVLVAAISYIIYIYKIYTVPLLNHQIIHPEVVLPAMIVASLFMTVGIFVFGWTSSPDLPWFPPLIGSALFIVGAFTIFQTGFNYLADSFPDYLASVFAGNDLFRSVIAGSFPLFGPPLFNNLATPKFPVAWGSSVLGFISLGMILIPILFYLNGPKLRARSKFADVYVSDNEESVVVVDNEESDIVVDEVKLT